MDRRCGTLRGLGVFVACERLAKPVDLLLLLFDEDAEVVDRPPRVLGRDAAAVAIVAGAAGGFQVLGVPKEFGVSWVRVPSSAFL
jgi:hypothetical protein